MGTCRRYKLLQAKCYPFTVDFVSEVRVSSFPGAATKKKKELKAKRGHKAEP